MPTHARRPVKTPAVIALVAAAIAASACSSAPGESASVGVQQAYKCSALNGCGDGTGGGGTKQPTCGAVDLPPCAGATCPRDTYLVDGLCEPCGTAGYPICPGAATCDSGANVGGVCETLTQGLAWINATGWGDLSAHDAACSQGCNACTLSADVPVPQALAGMGCTTGMTYTWTTSLDQAPTTFWACASFTGAAGYTAITDPYKSGCLGSPGSGYTLVGNFVWTNPKYPTSDFQTQWHQDNMGAGGPCLPPYSPPG